MTQLRAAVHGVQGDGPLLAVYPAVASIAAEPATVHAEVGARPVVHVVARDAAGLPASGVPVTFFTSDLAVAGPASPQPWPPAHAPFAQPLYAWRGGTATLTLHTPHLRPGDRRTTTVVVAVTDPGMAPDTLRRRTTDAGLRTEVGRSTLAAGDTTTIRLVARNTGRETVRFTASASCVIHFTVDEAGGRIAWPLGPRPACAPDVPFVLAPGDSLVREEVWRADDGRSPASPLAPGLYYIWAVAGGPSPGGGHFLVRTEETLILRVLPARP